MYFDWDKKACLTRGNVGGSHTRGNRIVETALAGLGRKDSNSQMSLPKLVFEVWPEFPFISERSAIRDFSRLSCQTVTCTAVQSKMNMVRCGQAMLERRPLRTKPRALFAAFSSEADDFDYQAVVK